MKKIGKIKEFRVGKRVDIEAIRKEFPDLEDIIIQ